MTEYLNCDACTAIVSTEMIFCEYCGDDFRHRGNSAELLKLRDDLDIKQFTLSAEEFLKLANTTNFRQHPIIKFRILKVQLIAQMTNDGILIAQEFCDILHTVNQINKISEGYWHEFTLYISVIMPTPLTRLFLDDFKAIKHFMTNNNLDKNGIVEQKLKQQVLITDLGECFFKEYNFYSNPANFINDESFIKKQEYLIEKYNKANNEIVK
jgi:hypothetical protein